jgi:hypothetical protein
MCIAPGWSANTNLEFSTDLFQKVGVLSAPQKHHANDHVFALKNHVMTTQNHVKMPKKRKTPPKNHL